MEKPIKDNYKTLEAYLSAMEVYVGYLEQKVSNLEYEVWEWEIFDKEQKERDDS